MANTDLGQTGILIRDNQVRAVKLVTHECDGAPVDPVEEHRTEVRYKNLGTEITEAQLEAIRSGTFDDLYVGDYWVLDGKVQRIVDIDYYYGKAGTGAETTHHLVVLPDIGQSGQTVAMHDTSDDPLLVEGMHYCDTDMCKTKMATYRAQVEALVGADHMLQMTKRIGDRSYDAKLWLMCLVNFVGEQALVIPSFEEQAGISYPFAYPDDDRRFALFAHSRRFDSDATAGTWFTDTVSGGGDPGFALVAGIGGLIASLAVDSRNAGVRAAYLLIA